MIHFGAQKEREDDGTNQIQADVETGHDIMEGEFYEIELFVDRTDFVRKANAYSLFCNLAGKNSAKEYKTPWQLIKDKLENADPHLALPKVIYLDQLFQKNLHKTSAGRYDVWGTSQVLSY